MFSFKPFSNTDSQSIPILSVVLDGVWEILSSLFIVDPTVPIDESLHSVRPNRRDILSQMWALTTRLVHKFKFAQRAM